MIPTHTFSEYDEALAMLERAGKHLRMQFNYDLAYGRAKELTDAQGILLRHRIATLNEAIRECDVDVKPLTAQDLREAHAVAVQA